MTKEEKASQALTAKSPTDISAINDSFSSYENAGLENVTSADIIVPRLNILQSLSPQLNPKKPEFINGSSVGDICDVGTGEIFKEGILFLPVYYRKDYLEWAPRSSGKGLVAIHDSSILDECTKNDKNQYMLSNGNYISETAQFFGLNITAKGRKSFIPMTSTQLKKARRLLTLSTGEKLDRPDGSTFTPPLFYRAYNLTTVVESNNEGEWSGWKVERGPTLPELAEQLGLDWVALKEEAVKFLETLRAGNAKGDLSEVAEEVPAGEGAM